jgi:hypothetical protein
MTVYHLYTQRHSEDIWHYDAIASFPEHVFGEKALGYMSHINVRYRVRTETDGVIVDDVTYEPDDDLRDKYKDYFLCPQVPKDGVA